MEVGRLVRDWFSRDPEAAMDYLRAMPRGVEFNNALFLILGSVAADEPARAIALAGELATNSEQRVVFNELFDGFARRDVREAVKNLALVPAGEARVNAIRALASRWSDKNLEGALAWAQKLEDSEDRSPAMESVLWSLAQDDPWRTLDLAARSLDDGPLERTVARVLQRVGEVDMQRASDLVKILPAGETQTHLALDLSRRFAADSPDAAIAWSSALPSEEMQQLALNNILDVWVESAATGAAHYVSHLPEGDEQDVAARHLGERYAGKNPDAALRWAQSLSSESAREAALIGVANGWAQQDAPAAVRWASELPPEHPARFDAVCSAISYWALTDPTAARAFARDLSPATLRRAALKAAGE